MTSIHILTVRTAAALGRLSTLQKRADKLPPSSAPVVKPLLKELADALEVLQVANQHLHQLLDELSHARQRTHQCQTQFNELVEILPLACIWTNGEGAIEQANPAAAALLNVSALHLSGRPLMLFVLERQKFTDALRVLTDGQSDTVAFTTTLRPRERRPRMAGLVGRKMAAAGRYCWFMRDEATNDRRESERREPSNDGTSAILRDLPPAQ